MDGGKHQVPRLGSVERQAHRLGVAHLADHQDVGVLAQRVQQRLRHRGGVSADLTLADEGLAGSQHVLDGAFDGDDVLDFTEVDFLQQRGERRGLARASRARDENQPVAPLDEAVQRGVKVEPFERRVKGRQQPDHKPDPACGPQDVDAAAHLSDHLGEVEGAALDEGRPAVPDGRACQFHQSGSRHWLTAHAEFSPHPEGHRHPSLKVQVGGAGLARQGHVAFQRHLGHQPKSRRVRGAPRRGRALSSQTSLFSPGKSSRSKLFDRMLAARQARCSARTGRPVPWGAQRGRCKVPPFLSRRTATPGAP